MKKIMFNDRYGLTRAVLEGRKTQTRRVIKPYPSFTEYGSIVWKKLLTKQNGSNTINWGGEKILNNFKEFKKTPF